jgi:hypothetical protein
MSFCHLFFFFYKIREQVLSGGWYQWEGRGHKERVEEGKYGGNAVYSCMKMEK